MTDDAELLRRYGRDGDEPAFAEVVRRRVDLVYAAALRQTRGDDALAREAVQSVFIDLARKAVRVAEHEVLVGWLHTATRFAVAKAIRAESRRRAREREAGAMNAAFGEPSETVDWSRLQPVLDTVLGELKERERAAILLRFFEEKTLAEVGAALALTETAARSCVDRALEKMQARLARRGVTSTTSALAIVLANQVATAAPAGLAAAATQAGLAAGAAGGAMGLGIFMGITKTQAVLCGALLAAGAGGFTLQHRANAQLADEVTILRRAVAENETIRSENARLARAASEAQVLNQTSGAELAQLSEEAAALKTRLAVVARTGAIGSSTRLGQGTTPATIFDLAQLDQRPTPQLRVPPKYPTDERKQGVTGKVLVEFVINEAGEVTEAKALQATTEAFAASAVEAMKQWKFSPGQKGGVPVGVRMQQPITFEMSSEPTPNWF